MKVTPEEQDMIDLIAETERVEALQADLATAQAQVAVMAEAIKRAKKWLADNDAALLDARIAHVLLYDVLRDALSAAPKVLWSANALVIGWDGAFKELLIEKGDLTFITGTEELEKYVGKQAQVIVLDKQGEGE